MEHRSNTQRLFGKLILIVAPIAVLLSIGGLYYITYEQSKRGTEIQAKTLENTGVRIAGSLRRLEEEIPNDEAMQSRMAREFLFSILGNPEIKCARVISTSQQEIFIVPSPVECQSSDIAHYITIDINGSNYSKLVIGYSDQTVRDSIQLQRDVGLSVLLSSFLIAIIFAWFGFRITIGKPIDQLVKKLIEARNEAQKANRAKSSFLANISHEIRTPMNGIIGTAELLSETALNETQIKNVDTILNSGRALISIIEDVLDFSKIEAEKLELIEDDFFLPDVVYEVVALLNATAQAKGIELFVDFLNFDHSTYRGDETRVRQILLNLLGNAVKFTTKGSVTLKLSEQTQAEQSIITFSVTDTGIGIEPENLENIFAAFAQADESTTRKYGGTGLGLAISKRLVELLGGTLTARSEVGVGSTFEFSIPLTKIPERPTEQNVRLLTELANTRPIHILIIDDTPLNLDILADYLSTWGFNPIKAQSAEMGITAMQMAHSAGMPMDGVIVDYQMPDQNGTDFAKQVKSIPHLSDTPLILLSSSHIIAKTMDEDKTLFTSSFMKPIFPRHLAQALASALIKMPDEEKQTAPKSPFEGMLENIELLIVDDNEINRTVVAQQLAITKADISFAQDGIEAVQRYKDTRPTLVLMDLSMPNMGGIEATEFIREWERANGLDHAFIFALSANVLKEKKQQCKEAGMNGFIAKPVQKTDLLKMLHDTILNTKDGTKTAQTSRYTFENINDLKDSMGAEKTSLLLDKLYTDISALKQEIEQTGKILPHIKAIHKNAGAAGILGFIKLAQHLQKLEIECANHNEPAAQKHAECLHALNVALEDIKQIKDALKA